MFPPLIPLFMLNHSSKTQKYYSTDHFPKQNSTGLDWWIKTVIKELSSRDLANEFSPLNLSFLIFRWDTARVPNSSLASADWVLSKLSHQKLPPWVRKASQFLRKCEISTIYLLLWSLVTVQHYPQGVLSILINVLFTHQVFTVYQPLSRHCTKYFIF